ncbi:MAG: hypothetical protein WDN69_37460 [Aliidongia sp.]
MLHGDVTELVLDQVQIFDQQITLTRHLAKQRSDLSCCRRIDLPSLRNGSRNTTAGAWMTRLMCGS